MIFNIGGYNATASMPAFTYSGEYDIIDDGKIDGVQNWRIKFLTSGNFVPKYSINVDVFCVGAGGGCPDSEYYCGGGAGGHTTTTPSVILKKGTSYEIIVGAGSTGKGGSTSAFGCSATGGNPGFTFNGGSGGTGGGGYGAHSGGKGGANGSDGEDGVPWVGNGEPSHGTGGSGSGESTYEFGGTSGTLYCGGGAGSTSIHTNDGIASVPALGGAGGGGNGGLESGALPTNGQTNTGGGGGGRYVQGSSTGGSGIVVIRNHR